MHIIYEINNNKNKKGLNIKELKEYIKKNKNSEENNEKTQRIEGNKQKYTKLESSESESSDSENEKRSKNNEEEESIREDKTDKNKNKDVSATKKKNIHQDEKSHPKFAKSTKVNYTLSILIPSIIVDNAQSKELRTYLIGELARTIGIFKISEVIIFHDKLKDNSRDYINYFIKNLQYLETPQYLRKSLFPLSENLKLSVLMNPLESQHHLRKDE